ncbi:hypothetical protein JKG47_12840 [Acidithiobacillus sp. MC6.1]|nr:hypothetical protein [Acidithiobacillus sp. MC6.1]
MTNNNSILPTGSVRCADCAQWIADEPLAGGQPPIALGFCGVTKDRTVQVPETGKKVPDRQGLPPNTHPSHGYAACFPLAPRRCEAFRTVSG